MSKPLFNVEKILNIKIDQEYKNLFRDIYKFFVVLTIMVILASYSNTSLSKLIMNHSKELLLLVTLALCAYHLVLTKLIHF
jgi:hypothetical protein